MNSMDSHGIRGVGMKAVLRALFCAFTLAFLIAALFAPDLPQMFEGFWRICSGPAQLTKDYFKPELGSMSGSLLNYFVVGCMLCALTFLPDAAVNGGTALGYFLTIGFCSYGINALNILPLMLGVLVYARVKKVPFGSQINMAMFATGLAPLISELMVRYPGEVDVRGFTLAGILLALAVGLLIGFVTPVLCAHAPGFHKGMSIYNAAPPAGFLGLLACAALYKTRGLAMPPVTADLGQGYPVFANAFCIACFALCIVAGFILNGNSLRGYARLLRETGYACDLTAKYAPGLIVAHIGVYGLFTLAYYNLIGASFNGVTFGVLICILSCAPMGATPVNVLPIMLGYLLASRLGVFALNQQSIIVALCFATGLAPISGEYGPVAGVVAGMLHYCLVTSVPVIHGGFNLYNGGFTASIVCFLFAPLLGHFLQKKSEKNAPGRG